MPKKALYFQLNLALFILLKTLSLSLQLLYHSYIKFLIEIKFNKCVEFSELLILVYLNIPTI